MLHRLLLLIALLLPVPAAAQALEGRTLEGSWAFEIGGAVIFRFDMAPVEGKAGEWRGTWSKPASFASDGNNFQKLTGPPVQVKSMAGIEFDDTVELSFNDPRPGAIPDIFSFRLVDPDAAEMTYVGTGLAPYLLQRVTPETKLGPWTAAATYSRDVTDESSPAIPEEEAPPLPPPADPNGFRLPPGGVPSR